MNAKNDRGAKLAEEDAKRITLAKAKIIDGWISAISVDACIFTEGGNRLEHGNLKHLEQFKGNSFQLVFSEVTLREVQQHIAAESDATKIKLRTALRSAGKHWDLKADTDDILKSLIGNTPPIHLASEQIEDFVKRCGALILKAERYADISQMLNRYFDTHPPFETSENKKSEFPDAFALISLEKWAVENGRGVLLVTKDKSCKRFCDESTYLHAVHGLSEALSLIQERDVHLTNLCGTIEARIRADLYDDLPARLEDVISRNIWDINWEVDADAAYQYEDEIQDISVGEVTYPGAAATPLLRPISYDGISLVVETTVTVEVHASSSFSFSIRDTVDREWMCIGNVEARCNPTIELEVLLTFEELDSLRFELTEIELLPARRRLSFGYVEPDMHDEDPNSEYY